MPNTTRLAIEVVAGLMPGKDPDPQFTKRFVIQSDEWFAAAGLTEEGMALKQGALLAEVNGQAAGYAQMLMAMPQRLNWVRMDWVWF